MQGIEIRWTALTVARVSLNLSFEEMATLTKVDELTLRCIERDHPYNPFGSMAYLDALKQVADSKRCTRIKKDYFCLIREKAVKEISQQIIDSENQDHKGEQDTYKFTDWRKKARPALRLVDDKKGRIH